MGLRVRAFAFFFTVPASTTAEKVRCASSCDSRNLKRSKRCGPSKGFRCVEVRCFRLLGTAKFNAAALM